MSDLLIGIRRFKNCVRWRKFCIDKAREEENAEEENSDTDVDEEEIIKFERKGDEGLKTGLKPEVRRNAPIASLEVESFLNEVENNLIKQVDEYFCENVTVEEQDDDGKVIT